MRLRHCTAPPAAPLPRVVERRQHGDLPGHGVDAGVEQAGVAAQRLLGAGRAVRHLCERVRLVEGVVLAAEGRDGRIARGWQRPGGEARVAGGQHAAHHRDQMRDEGDRRAVPVAAGQGRELLHHLRLMAVAVEAVRAEVLADLGEVRRQLQRPARAGDARLRIDDHAAVEPARRRQRRQAQDGGGRVAARHGDQLRLADGVAVQFGQAVDGVGQELRRGVVAVPALVVLRFVQAEVGAAGRSPACPTR